ncbi:hypothetical protein A9K97_gp343 [Tokyovirus A1]|uniref:hypothetical protein n=1 Tax=Tokyovirus A1 TaxID=1826170 RepID=UPI0007A970A4|nr:hypothetical protein A9K97_gp343 [Tokyovirus A1]BAU80008.1 hypothetical protein [Tokyovirus A1]
MRDFVPLTQYKRGFVFADFDFIYREEPEFIRDISALEKEGVSFIRRKRFKCGRNFHGKKKYAYDISWKYRGDSRIFHLDVDLKMEEKPKSAEWNVENFELRVSQGLTRLFVGDSRDLPNTREGRVARILAFLPEAKISSDK